MSKAMTKGQTEHLSNRIGQEIRAAITAFESKLPDPKYPSNEQKLAAICSGVAKLKKDIDGRYTYLFDSFTYPEVEKAYATEKANRLAIAKFSAPLYAKKQAIMDNAILGSADEALAVLNKFVVELSKKK